MDPQALLRAAEAAPVLPGSLDLYRDTIAALHAKRYSFRQIAAFLKERGVKADAGAVHRLFMRYATATTPTPEKEKTMYSSTTVFVVPPSAAYVAAIQKKPLAEHETAMLRAHHAAPNRTITYTELAAAAGWDNHGAANLHYGYLGRRLGEALDLQFPPDGKGGLFYSAALGMGSPYRGEKEEFLFVMHSEVAKAIEELGLV